MPARSLVSLALCALLAGACEGKARRAPTETTTGPGTDRGEAAPRGKIPAVRCVRRDAGDRALDDDLAKALTAHAERIGNALAGTTALPVWNMLDPSVRERTPKEAFMANLETLAARVRRAGPPTVADIVFLDVAPGVNGRMKISCPGQDGPWTVATRVDGADLAIVYVEYAGEPLPPRVVVRLRRGEDGWALLGLESAAHRYRGADATAHLARAEAARTAGRPLEAYLEAGIAQVLAMRGQGVRTPLTDRVARLLGGGDLEAKARAAAAEAAGLPPERLVSVGLFHTDFDLAPRLRYVTAIPNLGEAEGPAARKEAAGLARALVRAVPGLRETFDTVIFEALAERPVSRDAKVDAARIAIAIDGVDDGGTARGAP